MQSLIEIIGVHFKEPCTLIHTYDDPTVVLSSRTVCLTSIHKQASCINDDSADTQMFSNNLIIKLSCLDRPVTRRVSLSC